MSIVDSELARHTLNDLFNEHLSVYNNDINVNNRKLSILPNAIAAIESYPLVANSLVSRDEVYSHFKTYRIM
jgi:hypothetical protein